jgi:mannose-6-phosphate isomerase-like protein (cupin superfamily)
MDVFDLSRIDLPRRPDGGANSELLSSDVLSVSFSILPAGATNVQQPHTEDEVYYIISGRAAIRVAEEDWPVGPGSLVYVATGVEHHFHSIEEELRLLIFWAPPHRSSTEEPTPTKG